MFCRFLIVFLVCDVLLRSYMMMRLTDGIWSMSSVRSSPSRLMISKS